MLRISKEMRGAVVIITDASARAPGSSATRVESLEAGLPVSESTCSGSPACSGRRSAAPGLRSLQQGSADPVLALGGKGAVSWCASLEKSPQLVHIDTRSDRDPFDIDSYGRFVRSAPDGNADVFSES